MTAIAVIAGALSQWADAEVLVYESFDYTSGSSLLGAAGGFGFAEENGGWYHQNGSHTVTASSLEWNALEHQGNAVYTPAMPSSGSSSAYLSRNLATPFGAAGTTRYVSFLIRPEGVYGEGLQGGFIGLSLVQSFASTTGGELFIGGAHGDEYLMENLGGAGAAVSTVMPEVGTSAFLVVKAEFVSGNDTFTLYVNPQPGMPEPAGGIAKTDIDLSNIYRICIRSGGAFTLDEIRIGETYADVTQAVPEPGVLILLATGAIVALGWQRVRTRTSGPQGEGREASTP